MAVSSEEASVSRRRYRPLLELGRGGMARVYLAESLASGVRKLVVLKILNSDLANDTDMRAAFQREAELSARMNHPNVVQVYEVVEFGGIPVMVMEYLDGVALSRLQQQERLPLRLHLYALTQVLAGLSHFHHLKDFDGKEYNAVHRDVSPQNVMVLHEGTVKVLDFGIAKISVAPDQQTRAGMIKGKIHYMPPEQLLGETDLDPRADIFAVGVMLWEAIAGRRMWEGTSEANVVRNLANGELPKLREVVPNVPIELERIVERALARERNERYESAEAMQLELELALLELEGHVRPRELTEFMQKHLGDRREYQQRTIDRALRAPTTSVSGIMECVTPPPVEIGNASSMRIAVKDYNPLMGDDLIRSISSRSGVTPIVQRARWRAAPVLVGGLALAIAGGIYTLRDSPSAPPTSAAPQSQPMTQLGTGQVQRTSPVGAKSSMLEVRAPGIATEKQPMPPGSDTSLEVVLPPEATAPAVGVPSPTRDQPEASKRVSIARGRQSVKGAKPASEKATAGGAAPTATPAVKQDGCNPPYKLGADGIKTYKPECF